MDTYKIPTFYRQKIALGMIEIFGGELTKLDFQKLLFLFTQEQDKKSYDFVPYFYGCYSFQAQADLKTMQTYKLLDLHDNVYHKAANVSFSSLLKKEDHQKLLRFYEKFKNYFGDKLINFVYNKYPFYAKNSKIADKYLDEQKLKSIKEEKDIGAAFFTIGYEGKTFESYINELIEANIDTVYDVRKNPFSMKFGFSKNMMKHTMENIGINYVHLPELGIESEKRTELNSLDDYQALFKEYEESVLNKSPEAKDAMALLHKASCESRIAITCFEKDIRMCHRGRIAAFIENQYGINISHL